MNTNRQTDEQRSAAWDRLAAEMRAYEQGKHNAENAMNAFLAIAVIAAAGLVAWVMLTVGG